MSKNLHNHAREKQGFLSAPENETTSLITQSDDYCLSVLSAPSANFYDSFEQLLRSLVRTHTVGVSKSAGLLCRFLELFCEKGKELEEEKIHVVVAGISRILNGPELKENTFLAIFSTLKMFWQNVASDHPSIFSGYAWTLIDILIGRCISSTGSENLDGIFGVFYDIWKSNENRCSAIVFNLIREFEEAETITKATAVIVSFKFLFTEIVLSYPKETIPLYCKQAMQRMMTTFRSFSESIQEFPIGLESQLNEIINWFARLFGRDFIIHLPWCAERLVKIQVKEQVEKRDIFRLKALLDFLKSAWSIMNIHTARILFSPQTSMFYFMSSNLCRSSISVWKSCCLPIFALTLTNSWGDQDSSKVSSFIQQNIIRELSDIFFNFIHFSIENCRESRLSDSTTIAEDPEKVLICHLQVIRELHKGLGSVSLTRALGQVLEITSLYPSSSKSAVLLFLVSLLDRIISTLDASEVSVKQSQVLHAYLLKLSLKPNISRYHGKPIWDSILKTVEKIGLSEKGKVCDSGSLRESGNSESVKRRLIHSMNTMNFRPIHFQKVIDFLFEGNKTSEDWRERLFYVCGGRKLISIESLPSNPDEREDFLSFWIAFEASRYCLLSRLRTPLGPPPQTLDMIYQKLKSLYDNSETNRFLHLLKFVELLCKQWIFCRHGVKMKVAVPQNSFLFFESFDSDFEAFYLKCFPFILLKPSETLEAKREFLMFVLDSWKRFGMKVVYAVLEPNDKQSKFEPFVCMFLKSYYSLLHLNMREDADFLVNIFETKVKPDLIPKLEESQKTGITVLKRSYRVVDEDLVKIIDVITSVYLGDFKRIQIPIGFEYLSNYLTNFPERLEELKLNDSMDYESLKADFSNNPETINNFRLLFLKTLDLRCLCRCLKNFTLLDDNSWLMAEAQKFLSAPKIAYHYFCFQATCGEVTISLLQNTLSLVKKTSHKYHLLLYLFSCGNLCSSSIWELAYEKIEPEIWKPVIPIMISKINETFHGILARFCKQGSLDILTDIAWYSLKHSDLFEEFRSYQSDLFDEVRFFVNRLQQISVLWDEAWLNQLEVWSIWYWKYVVSEPKYQLLKLKLFYQSLESFKIEYWSPERDLSQFEASFKSEFSELLYAGEANLSKALAKGDCHSSKTLREIYHPFKRFQRKLQSIVNKSRSVSLKSIDPALSSYEFKFLSMPGLERDRSVGIVGLLDEIQVIPTKTKPKKIVMMGSDGNKYQYLVKGAEDIQWDSRVGQFFSLLKSDGSQDIFSHMGQVYQIKPIGFNGGLIQWVSDDIPCYNLIRMYQHLRSHTRDAGVSFKPREVFMREALKQAREYPEFKGMSFPDQVGQWLETRPRSEWPAGLLLKVYEALKCSDESSSLLMNAIHLASPSAAREFETRIRLTKSLSCMNILGYLIGLGDRHLDNTLIGLESGKVTPIDFTLCLDRGKLLRIPELVPFRLTEFFENAIFPGLFERYSRRVIGKCLTKKIVIEWLVKMWTLYPVEGSTYHRVHHGNWLRVLMKAFEAIPESLKSQQPSILDDFERWASSHPPNPYDSQYLVKFMEASIISGGEWKEALKKALLLMPTKSEKDMEKNRYPIIYDESEMRLEEDENAEDVEDPLSNNQADNNKDVAVDSNFGISSAATTVIHKLNEASLSLKEDFIQRLIKFAKNPQNLSMMYEGWTPWI